MSEKKSVPDLAPQLYSQHGGDPRQCDLANCVLLSGLQSDLMTDSYEQFDRTLKIMLNNVHNIKEEAIKKIIRVPVLDKKAPTSNNALRAIIWFSDKMQQCRCLAREKNFSDEHQKVVLIDSLPEDFLYISEEDYYGYYFLQTKNNRVFQISQKALQLSETWTSLVKKSRRTDKDFNTKRVIPVDKIDGKTLKWIVKWCEDHKEARLPTKDELVRDDITSDFYSKIKKVNPGALFKLFEAVSELKMEILGLIVAKIFSLLSEGKTSAEREEILGLPRGTLDPPKGYYEYILESGDNTKISITSKALELSKTLSDIVKERRRADKNFNTKRAIRVDNISGNTLRLIVKWCEEHKGKPISKNDVSDAIKISDFDEKLMNISPEALSELLCAAKELKIHTLRLVASKKLSLVNKEKKSEEPQQTTSGMPTRMTLDSLMHSVLNIIEEEDTDITERLKKNMPPLEEICPIQ